MIKIDFSRNARIAIGIGLFLDVVLSLLVSVTALSFYVQAGLVFFVLTMSAQYSRAYLMDESLDIKFALSRAFWVSLLFLVCSSLSGIMLSFTIVADDYLNNNGMLKAASNVKSSFIWLYALYAAPIVLLMFVPQVLVALNSIPFLYDILFWSCHLVYIVFVAKEMGVKPLQKIFHWRMPSKKTVAYTVLGIFIFLLTSPALYIIANYSAVSGVIAGGGYVLHLAMAAIMYSIQPLVEELLARTGLLAFLNYFGIAGESKDASFHRRFLHKLCVGFLMGYLFGFMHTSVVGATFLGLSALLYHTIMGIVFAMVSLWTDGIEISTVFHSMHNYSVTVSRLFSSSIAGAFKAAYLIPVALGRMLLTWLGVSAIDALFKDNIKKVSSSDISAYAEDSAVTSEDGKNHSLSILDYQVLHQQHNALLVGI